MPHFGLMDESAMPEDKAALLRAQLHLRGGRRRMHQEKYAAALAALHDAVSSGMKWYILTLKEPLVIQAEESVHLRTDRELFSSLAQAGVLDGMEDFDYFDDLLDQAFTGKVLSFNAGQVLSQVERWLSQLGVMPFDEGALPPEDPETY